MLGIRALSAVMLLLVLCENVRPDVRMIVRHPQAAKHNTETRHSQAYLADLAGNPQPRKGVTVYRVRGGHIVMTEGRTVSGVRSVRMHAGRTKTMIVQVRRHALIRRMDFEQGPHGTIFP